MDKNEGESFIIDIDHLESSIKDMMSYDSSKWHKCCIFKTPSILKRHNREAYMPNAFSIGPLHHGKAKLKATEKIKAKYLQGLLDRSVVPDLMLRSLINSIMELQEVARECYAEIMDDISPEKLVQILVIDGCFIIELFRKKAYPADLLKRDDPIFSKACMLQFLYHDLILLENQVPWMVIERLFNLTSSHHDELPLINLVLKFMNTDLLSARIQWQLRFNIQGIKHFVDLFRKLSTSSLEEMKEQEGWESLPSATSLVEAGIKLEVGKSDNLLDVKFSDHGVLEIPQLVIHDVTETVFRNLISYEQCQPNVPQRITSYAMFLDSLINTAKDMDILCKKQIIRNSLNPEDAANIFNKLYHDTYVKNYYYHDICKNVNKFCDRRWPRYRALLLHDYFSSPWSLLSTLAAIILLILTLVQTWYSITS